MGLGILIVGLAVFLATHVFVSFREARASVIERVGLSLYRTLFAIVSLVGLALIIWGYAQYRAHDLIQLWSPPAFMRHITIGLVFFAAIFIVAPKAATTNAASNGIDILALTMAAKDLPEENYPAH